MRKAWSLIIWVIISVLVFFILYKVYNHFDAKAQLEPIRPQTSDNMEDDSGQSDSTSENSQQDRDSENNIGNGNDGRKDSEEAGKYEGNAGKDRENAENKSNVENNEKFMAPDFTLEDIDGKKVSLSDFRGKIVFLNFWATWCQYCVMEMPDLEKVHREFSKGDDAVILTINSDEDSDIVRKYIAENDLTLPVLMDNKYEVNWMYGISGIPVTYVIDRSGYIYGRISGMTDKDTILRVFEILK